MKIFRTAVNFVFVSILFAFALVTSVSLFAGNRSTKKQIVLSSVDKPASQPLPFKHSAKLQENHTILNVLNKVGFQPSFFHDLKKDQISTVVSDIIVNLRKLRQFRRFYLDNKDFLPPFKDLDLGKLSTRHNVTIQQKHLQMVFDWLFLTKAQHSLLYKSEQQSLLDDLIKWFGITKTLEDRIKLQNISEGLIVLATWAEQFIFDHLEVVIKKELEMKKLTFKTKEKYNTFVETEIKKRKNSIKRQSALVTDFIDKFKFTLEQVLEISTIEIVPAGEDSFFALTHTLELIKNKELLRLLNLFFSPKPEHQIFDKILNLFLLSKLPLPLGPKSKEIFSQKFHELFLRTQWSPEKFLDFKNFFAFLSEGLSSRNLHSAVVAFDKLLDLHQPKISFSDKVADRVSTSLSAKLQKGLLLQTTAWLNVFSDLRNLLKNRKSRPKPNINDESAYGPIWNQLKKTLPMLPAKIKDLQLTGSIVFNFDLLRQSARDNVPFSALNQNQRKELGKLKFYVRKHNYWTNFAFREGGVVWQALNSRYRRIYDFIKKHWVTLRFLWIEKLGPLNLSIFDFLTFLDEDRRLILLDWERLARYFATNSHQDLFLSLFEEMEKIAHLSDDELESFLQDSLYSYRLLLQKAHLSFRNLLPVDNVSLLQDFLQTTDAKRVYLSNTEVSAWPYGSVSSTERQEFLDFWTLLFNQWKSDTSQQQLVNSSVAERKKIFGAALYLLWGGWKRFQGHDDNFFVTRVLASIVDHFRLIQKDVAKPNNVLLSLNLKNNVLHKIFGSSWQVLFGKLFSLQKYFRTWTLSQKRLFVQDLTNMFQQLSKAVSRNTQVETQLFNAALAEMYSKNNQDNNKFFRNPFHQVHFSIDAFLHDLYLLQKDDYTELQFAELPRQHSHFANYSNFKQFLRRLRWFHFFSVDKIFPKVLRRIHTKLQSIWTKLIQSFAWLRKIVLKNEALTTANLNKFSWTNLPPPYDISLFDDLHWEETFVPNLPTGLLLKLLSVFKEPAKIANLKTSLLTFAEQQLKDFWVNLNQTKVQTDGDRNLFLQLLYQLRFFGFNHLPFRQHNLNFELEHFPIEKRHDSFVPLQELNFRAKKELIKLFFQTSVQNYADFLEVLKITSFKKFFNFLTSLKAIKNKAKFSSFSDTVGDSVLTDIWSLVNSSTFDNLSLSNDFASLTANQQQDYLSAHRDFFNLYPRWVIFMRKQFSANQLTLLKTVQTYLRLLKTLKIHHLNVQLPETVPSFANGLIDLSVWLNSDESEQLSFAMLMKLYAFRKYNAQFVTFLENYIHQKLLQLHQSQLFTVLQRLDQQVTNKAERDLFKRILNLFVKTKWQQLLNLMPDIAVLAKAPIKTILSPSDRNLALLFDYASFNTLKNVRFRKKLEFLALTFLLPYLQERLAKINYNLTTFWQYLVKFARSSIFVPHLVLANAQVVDLAFLQSTPTLNTSVRELSVQTLTKIFSLYPQRASIIEELESRLSAFARHEEKLRRLGEFLKILDWEVATPLDDQLLKKVLHFFPWLNIYLARWNFKNIVQLKPIVFYVLKRYFATSWGLIKDHWVALNHLFVLANNSLFPLDNGNKLDLEFFHQNGKLLSFDHLSFAAFQELFKLQSTKRAAFQQILTQHLKDRFRFTKELLDLFLPTLQQRGMHQLQFRLKNLPTGNNQVITIDLLPLYAQNFHESFLTFNAKTFVELDKIRLLSKHLQLKKLLNQQLLATSPTTPNTKDVTRFNTFKIVVSTVGGVVAFGSILSLVWWARKFYFSA